jgi:hypothetical protein
MPTLHANPVRMDTVGWMQSKGRSGELDVEFVVSHMRRRHAVEWIRSVVRSRDDLDWLKPTGDQWLLDLDKVNARFPGLLANEPWAKGVHTVIPDVRDEEPLKDEYITIVEFCVTEEQARGNTTAPARDQSTTRGALHQHLAARPLNNEAENASQAIESPSKELRPLLDRLKSFQALHAQKDSDARKTRVRELEAEVKTDKLVASPEDFNSYRTGDLELGRIVAYLLVENGKVNSSPELWRENIQYEWELLSRSELRFDQSRMPLYYAVRAYFRRLRAAPETKETARGDRLLLSEIHAALSRNDLDRDSRLRSQVMELLFELDSPESPHSHPTILAALISRRGALWGAMIAAGGAVAVGLMTNWDKMFSSPKSGTVPAAPTSKSSPRP